MIQDQGSHNGSICDGVGGASLNLGLLPSTIQDAHVVDGLDLSTHQSQSRPSDDSAHGSLERNHRGSAKTQQSHPHIQETGLSAYCSKLDVDEAEGATVSIVSAEDSGGDDRQLIKEQECTVVPTADRG